MTETGTQNQEITGRREWIPYVVPMALFMLLTSLEGGLPKSYYVWVYALKAVLVTAALVACRSTWRDARPALQVLPIAILVGLAVCAGWVLIENRLPYPHFLGKRTAFNPFTEIPDSGQRWFFIVCRMYGLSLMVPLMEELFWRSFLIRFITRDFYINERFREVPIGEYTMAGFWTVALLFGLAHPEWLVAILCAVAYGLLLRQTRSVFACFVAHAVTNSALGIYVLTSHDWKFW